MVGTSNTYANALVLESPEGEKVFFDIHVKRDTYDYTIRKQIDKD